MIYEIRTYRIAPGSLAEVEKRFGEGYEYRKKYSELTAFLHTEIGPLNEIVHIWPYRDLAERARIRGGGQGFELATEDFGIRPRHEVGNPRPVLVLARRPSRQGGTGLRASLLHAQAGHAARHGQGLGGEGAGAHEAVAARRRRWRRVRPGQRLHPHLGVLEHGPAHEDPGRSAAEGRLAAAGRRRSSPHAGEQDPAASLVLAAPVGLWGGSLQGAPASSPAPLVYSRSDIDRSSSACLNEGRGRLRSDQNGVPGHRRARAPRDPWRHSRPGSADRRRRREDLRRRRASGREDR